jgi:hypothetical protein
MIPKTNAFFRRPCLACDVRSAGFWYAARCRTSRSATLSKARSVKSIFLVQIDFERYYRYLPPGRKVVKIHPDRLPERSPPYHSWIKSHRGRPLAANLTRPAGPGFILLRGVPPPPGDSHEAAAPDAPEDTTSLLSTSEGLALARAFMCISNVRLRRRIVDLVEEMAAGEVPARSEVS